MAIGDTTAAARQRAQTWRLPFTEGSASGYSGMTMSEIIEARTRELEAEGVFLDALRLPVSTEFLECVLVAFLGSLCVVGALFS